MQDGDGEGMLICCCVSACLLFDCVYVCVCVCEAHYRCCHEYRAHLHI